MNFFVIGLPRSRTAWMANFLTYDGNYCYHEGMRDCTTIEEYKQKLGNDGDSSTGLMLFDINKEFPDAQKLIIHRNVEYALDFMLDTYGVYDRDYMEYLEREMGKIQGWHIEFEEIDHFLPEIWEYLIGTPFDEKRAEILLDQRIEIKDPYCFDQEKLKALWNNLNIVIPKRIEKCQ